MSGKSSLFSIVKKTIVTAFATVSVVISVSITVLWFAPFKTPTPLEKRYCAFCDPAVIERQKFYEDKDFYILYTHKPITKGHCLVVPKQHVVYFQDMNNRQMSQMALVIDRAHQIIYKAFNQHSYLILQKNGLEVGQEVPHVHFHYIPRDNDQYAMLPFMTWFAIRPYLPPMTHAEMKEMTTRLTLVNNSLLTE